jgi:hypothetical protein
VPILGVLLLKLVKIEMDRKKILYYNDLKLSDLYRVLLEIMFNYNLETVQDDILNIIT